MSRRDIIERIGAIWICVLFISIFLAVVDVFLTTCLNRWLLFATGAVGLGVLILLTDENDENTRLPGIIGSMIVAIILFIILSPVCIPAAEHPQPTAEPGQWGESGPFGVSNYDEDDDGDDDLYVKLRPPYENGESRYEIMQQICTDGDMSNNKVCSDYDLDGRPNHDDMDPDSDGDPTWLDDNGIYGSGSDSLYGDDNYGDGGGSVDVDIGDGDDDVDVDWDGVNIDWI